MLAVVLSKIVEGDMFLRTCVCWLVVLLNSCGQSSIRELTTIQYITASEKSALLAFVPVTEGYQLVHCNSLGDLLDDTSRCRIVSQQLTIEQLTEVRNKIEAELATSSGYHRWLLPTLLAVASAIVSKAVVRDLIKVVPITFVVGIVLSYGQKRLLQIVQFHEEKRVIVEELQDMNSEHRSSTSLTIVEEVLLSYLRPEA